MHDYIQKALRTEDVSLFKVDNPRLLHAAIGVMTETSELLLAEAGDETNLKEEMGDVCWYLALVCDDLDLTFDDLETAGDWTRVQTDPFKALLGAAGDALDVVKRGLYYGLDLDTESLTQHFGTALLALLQLAHLCGWSLSHLQETNIAKLTKRYPDKLTPETALNRNTDAEREVIENA